MLLGSIFGFHFIKFGAHLKKNVLLVMHGWVFIGTITFDDTHVHINVNHGEFK